MERRVVVFPHPDGPRRVKSSPCSTSKLTPSMPPARLLSSGVESSEEGPFEAPVEKCVTKSLTQSTAIRPPLIYQNTHSTPTSAKSFLTQRMGASNRPLFGSRSIAKHRHIHHVGPASLGTHYHGIEIHPIYPSAVTHESL